MAPFWPADVLDETSELFTQCNQNLVLIFDRLCNTQS